MKLTAGCCPLSQSGATNNKRSERIFNEHSTITATATTTTTTTTNHNNNNNNNNNSNN